MLVQLGYGFFALAAFIACTNFYLSFVRAPLYWWFGIEPSNVSGIPLLGNVLLAIAMLLIANWPSTLWGGAVVICAIDTGGLPWLIFSLLWHRKK